MKRTRTMAYLLALVLAATPCLAKPVDVEAHEDVARRMIEAVNARDFDALDDLVASDVRRHSAATPGVRVENLRQFKEFLRQDLRVFPDAQQEINLMFAGGDKVAIHATLRGTQKGSLGPFPPTGKRLEIPFIGILRFEGDKIAEMWVEWDNLNVLVQLGHLSKAPGPDDSGGRGEE